MNKHLYDSIAERWLRPGATIWIISDPHFRNAESQGYRQSYPGDDELVKRINAKVGKNDTLIILGDIGDVEYVKKIKGYKILLLGNHDKGASNYKRVSDYQEYCYDDKNSEEFKNIVLNKIKEFTDYGYTDKICQDGRRIVHKLTLDNHLFDEVYEGPVMINDRVILSHEPVAVPEYMFNIHGHTHGLPHIYDERHLNVCAEAIDYTPINMLKLIQKGLLKNTKSIHELTVQEATKRKVKRNLKAVDKMIEETLK